jgi:hypothetical protein
MTYVIIIRDTSEDITYYLFQRLVFHRRFYFGALKQRIH